MELMRRSAHCPPNSGQPIVDDGHCLLTFNLVAPLDYNRTLVLR